MAYKPEQLELTDGNAKQYFAILRAEQDTIERELGETLIWYNNPDVRSCRIYLRKDADVNDRADWKNQHRWLLENLQRLNTVFRSRVMKLSVGEAQGTTHDTESLETDGG